MDAMQPGDELRIWLDTFNSAMARREVDEAASLFHAAASWRDFAAFTWNIVTVEGRDAVRDLLAVCLERTAPTAFLPTGPASARDGSIEAVAEFETAVARCRAVIRLRDGRCWTLLTALTGIEGPEEDGARADFAHDYRPGRRSWRRRREQDAAELGVTRQPFCLIVGVGHCGLALAALLKQLNVSTLLIDRRERPSDTWRNRHDTLALHSPSFFDGMPGLSYPEHWPTHPAKDQFADWLDAYRHLMELDVWTGTECVAAVYDEVGQHWRVTVERAGQRLELRPRELVLATGLVGTPQRPELPGQQHFAGEVRHAGEHRSSVEWRGRRCVVVGAGTTAHDLCVELWEAGADVTMVQRSPSIVIRLERLLAMFAELYGEQARARGITVERADLLFASLPLRLLLQQQQGFVRDVKELDAVFYEQLRQAGFLLTFGEDEAGILAQILRHPSGYYIDVGTSQLLIDGRIGLRSGVGVAGLTERAVRLSDGSELPADLVILATGYERSSAASILPEAMLRAVGPIWGFGSGIRNDPGPWIGELRNIAKPTAQQGLWFLHHGVGGVRFYARSLALQLKAREAGLATPVYVPRGEGG